MNKWEAYDYHGPRAREKQMSNSTFDTQDHGSMQHASQHNLSPVEGDHGPPHEADVYADHYARKSKWHYDRIGKHLTASMVKAGLYDFRARVARGWPK